MGMLATASDVDSWCMQLV